MDDELTIQLIVTVLTLASVGFGLMGFLTGRTSDRTVRAFIPVAVIMAFLVIAMMLWTDGKEASLIVVAWLVGLVAGHAVREKPRG